LLDKRLCEAWQARERVFPIHPVLTLAPEGLVLGAGTVLIPAEGVRRLTSLDGHEARVLPAAICQTALCSSGWMTYEFQHLRIDSE